MGKHDYDLHTPAERFVPNVGGISGAKALSVRDRRPRRERRERISGYRLRVTTPQRPNGKRHGKTVR